MSFLFTDRGLIWLGTLLYVAGFGLGCGSLLRPRNQPTSRVVLNTLLAAGLFFQTTGLYLRGLAVGGCPLSNKFEIIQFVAWSAMVLYFVVGPAFRVSLLGLFGAGYAALLAMTSLFIRQWDATAPGGGQHLFGQNPWIEFHAALAVFSYGVFGLLALTSLMHLLQDWNLRQKHLGTLFWFLPSVVQLSQINFRLLLAGVGLLTISLGVGAAWWVRDTATVNWPKLLVTCAVWLAYAIALGLRWRGRLHSNRFAWTAIVLLIAALVSLGPVNSSRGHETAPVAQPVP